MRTFISKSIGITLTALVLGVAATASAQQPGSPGLLVMQPMNNGFVLAPDVKITKVDGQVGTLTGGYCGWIHDDRLLIGAGGYWLADGKDDRGLAYGGLIVGWVVRPEHRVGVTAKGLIGFGRLTQPVTIAFGYARPEFFDHDGIPLPSSRRLKFHDDFVLVEPEVDVHLRLAQHIRVSAGASYRAADVPRGFEDFARGASGSVALQFKFGT